MKAERTLLISSVTTALLLSAGLAQANITYSFSTGGNASSVGGIGNAQRSYAAPATGNPSLIVTGFVNTLNVNDGESTTTPATATSGPRHNEFTYAPIAFHGSTAGLGIQFNGETAPQHATDNSGNQEFMLLSFSSPVALTHLQLGWPDPGDGLDTDFMVLRYNGPTSGAASSNPTSDGFQVADMLRLNSHTADTTGNTRGLTTAGWELMGATTSVVNGNTVTSLTTDGLPVDNTSRSIGNSTFQSSSFWLVGARNSWLAAGSDGQADYGKLLSVRACISGTTGCGGTITTPGVPEPSSLALIGLGLLGTLKRWGKKR